MSDSPSPYSARTSLAALGTAEIFLVMLIRLRTAAGLDSASVPEDWRAGLQAACVRPEAGDAFDLLMHLLGPVQSASLDIRSLRCRCLGEGEALLLQTVSLLQHDRYDAAETILGRWLPPGVSRVAALQAQRFARALAATHLVVPLRHGEAGKPACSLPPASDRGLALVH